MTKRHELLMAVVTVVVVLACWGAAPLAQPFAGGLPACRADLATCSVNHAACTDELVTCNVDHASCTADLATCNLDHATCTILLSTCNNQLAAAQRLPATGQIICWETVTGDPETPHQIPCANTGQDGDVRAGMALSYTDNGDGTITDNVTKLMWAKKSDDASVHDKDNLYTWDQAFEVHIAGLNSGGGFAGYTDWRVPNVKELITILNYGTPTAPKVSSAFHNGCVASCTVLTCSCTGDDYYWTSTSHASFVPQGNAYVVSFHAGLVSAAGKDLVRMFVRAVRGGL